MPSSYSTIMDAQPVDTFQEISRVFLLIMYALLSKAVTSYHYVKGKYLEYKYSQDEIRPTERYYLTSSGRKSYTRESFVPKDTVYIEEWNDIKGHKKMIPLYEGDEIFHEWSCTPFDMPSAKCPWVWVGDKETEIDLTRTFDRFLVPGNVLRQELVSKLINITDHTNLIYIETKTFNQVKFPGDGITIQADAE